MKAIRKVPNSDRGVRAEPVFATLGDVPYLQVPPTYLLPIFSHTVFNVAGPAIKYMYRYMYDAY